MLQSAPNSSEVLRANFCVGGDPFERGVAEAQPRAVSESPSGLEVVSQVGGLAPVEIDDAEHRPFIAVGIGDDRMGGEGETLGLEHQMISHFPGRLEVLLYERRRQGQRLGRIVESGLVGGIQRKVARRPQIDAGELSNGVVVLSIIQAARGQRARIPRLMSGLSFPKGLDPGHHCLALQARWLGLGFGRWHIAGAEPVQHSIPGSKFAEHFGHGAKTLEIQLRLAGDPVMTVVAIVLQEGAHHLIKTRFQRGSRGRVKDAGHSPGEDPDDEHSW